MFWAGLQPLRVVQPDAARAGALQALLRADDADHGAARLHLGRGGLRVLARRRPHFVVLHDRRAAGGRRLARRDGNKSQFNFH